MAKPPSKRRGIALDSRADTVGPLVHITNQSGVSEPDSSVPASSGADPAGVSPTTMADLVEQLQRMNAEQDARLLRLEEQVRRQLTLQQEQITRQTRPPAARGPLLAMLVLVGVAALGYHLWPRLQILAGGLNRVSADVNRIAPELQAVREQVASLGSGMGQMAGTMTSVKDDVSNVRSDLSSLRRTVDSLPSELKSARTAGGGAGNTIPTQPRNASLMNDPFRRTQRRMPW